MISKFRLVFIFYPLLSQALDEESVKGVKCMSPQPPVARNVDYKSLLSMKRQYMPIQSELNFYRQLSSLLEQAVGDIPPSALQSPCTTYKWGEPSPKLFGFGNKTVTYVTTPVFENSFGFKGTWLKDKRARSFITLKEDNQFVFFMNCWEDGEASWSLISVTKGLEPSVVKVVLDHAESLGFDPKSVVHQNYEECPEVLEHEQTAGEEKNEL